MSYTTNRQAQGFSKTVETFLREGLISEIVSINDYSHYIGLTDNKDVRKIFHHIMEEEKRHYGLFLQAIRRVDSEEDEISKEVCNHVKISHKHKINEGQCFKGNQPNLLTFIRDSIKGELEAIILYDDLSEKIDDYILVNMIKSITKDEKEHVEELTKVLTLLDKDGYGPIG